MGERKKIQERISLLLLIEQDFSLQTCSQPSNMMSFLRANSPAFHSPKDMLQDLLSVLPSNLLISTHTTGLLLWIFSPYAPPTYSPDGPFSCHCSAAFRGGIFSLRQTLSQEKVNEVCIFSPFCLGTVLLTQHMVPAQQIVNQENICIFHHCRHSTIEYTKCKAMQR